MGVFMTPLQVQAVFRLTNSRPYGSTGMLSHSVSDYREACVGYLRDALLHPRMYYHSLGELEKILQGHGAAFIQMEVIDRDQSFQTCFSAWLYQEHQVSTSSGWGLAIEQLADAHNRDVDSVCSELVNKFFGEWGLTAD
jgi:hypothetical protein